jgi:hypothetical protein
MGSTSLLLFSGCQWYVIEPAKRLVEPAELSVRELAGALGVSQFCAETHFSSPCYARLVAITTDSTGKHRAEISPPSPDKNFKLQVLLFSEPKSGSLQRISYAIYSQHGGGGGAHFNSLEPETICEAVTSQNSDRFLYEIKLLKHSDATVIHIELETSATPFPKDSSSP